MPSPFWLYRCGITARDNNDHRFISSYTWLTTDPHDASTNAALLFFALQLAAPFASLNSTLRYTPVQRFAEEIWPQPRFLASSGTPSPWPQGLNVNAPEACFRLQRVGAAGGLGRTLLPILSDDWYLDLPHRRRIDRNYLEPLLLAGLGTFPTSQTAGSRTYKQVIFHRKDFTWEQVTTYRLLDNPCRRWQRWRTYPPSPPRSDDATWVPDEVGSP